jgi:8-oxo-dGTP pyrophosphatase MutT (NUDIX family)
MDMADSMKPRTLILAAGGIVLREGSRPRIAVVRLRREKAWVLPKGKLNPGEPAGHPLVKALGRWLGGATQPSARRIG